MTPRAITVNFEARDGELRSTSPDAPKISITSRDPTWKGVLVALEGTLLRHLIEPAELNRHSPR